MTGTVPRRRERSQRFSDTDIRVAVAVRKPLVERAYWSCGECLGQLDAQRRQRQRRRRVRRALPRPRQPRPALRRLLLRGGDLDRGLLPAELPGDRAETRERALLPECGGRAGGGLWRVPAVPSARGPG